MNKFFTYKNISIIIISFTILMGVWIKTDHLHNLQENTASKQVEKVEAATLVSQDEEMRAVWISYLDFQNAGVSKMSEAKFHKYINTMFDNCVKMHMNTVIVQVRPFSDAMYPSSYFPWSVIASGKQGKSPGYDPLTYMVTAAHTRGLQIEAWINPYRVTLATTKYKSLSGKNPGKKWKNRNVLYMSGQYYYNPAKEEVRTLIVNGIKEIVDNYEVDGIHFDDYFYPCLGGNYKKNFDAPEYKAYVKRCKSNDEDYRSIENWRRDNVNKLLLAVYQTVKEKNENIRFGVSPAGNINNLYAKDRYYCDVRKWMSQEGYVDYVCPQIYWSFTQKVCPYQKTVERWAALKKNNKVKLYIGLAAYRAGASYREAVAMGDVGWSKSRNVLKRQVAFNRKKGKVDGFMLFRYQNLLGKKTKTEMKNLMKILK